MNPSRQQYLVNATPLRVFPHALRAVLNKGGDLDFPSAKDFCVHQNRRDIAGRARTGVCHVELRSPKLFEGKAIAGMTWSRNQRLNGS